MVGALALSQEVAITSSLPSLWFHLLSHLVFFFSHLDTDKIQQQGIYFVDKTIRVWVNTWGSHWKDFLCIEIYEGAEVLGSVIKP